MLKIIKLQTSVKVGYSIIKMFSFFKKTKQRICKKRIFGFDIETYDNNLKFLLSSVVGYDRYNNKYEKTFYSKEDFIKELKTNLIFRNSYIFATNLGFDFFGSFFKLEDENFNICMPDSKLLFATTYFNGNEFSSSKKQDNKSHRVRASLTFIDTLNYAQMSVKKMGEIIGMPKLESPEFGNYPKDQEEMDYMIKYNLRDSWVTYKFMKFIIEKTEELGATFKLTAASTAMSLFKNKYLGDKVIFGNKVETLRELFKSYYGGRTEVFRRGYFKNVNFYDINSLYPSQMKLQVFADPNSQRTSRKNTDNFIMNYEGTSHVKIQIPFQNIPPLPFKTKDNTIYPYGIISGHWSHIELRYAIEECGCKILEVYSSIYYLLQCRPFEKFIDDMYTLRNKYKAEKNPMEVVTKLFMNSLYGKFGEKFDDKGGIIHKDTITKEQIDECDKLDRVGDYFVIRQGNEPKSHCIPIWAIYVAAYGRIRLHQELVKHPNTIYSDTDCMMTPDEVETSNELGDWKLEMEIKEGITVRPKFYATVDASNNEVVKIKGLSKRLSYKDFKALKINPTVHYDKFAKFREAIRRGFTPNELIPTHKEFSLEDQKRDWGNQTFSLLELQESNPILIEDNVQSRVANLNANKNPIINNGVNNIGEDAPIKKYENISMIEPNTPIIELEYASPNIITMIVKTKYMIGKVQSVTGFHKPNAPICTCSSSTSK